MKSTHLVLLCGAAANIISCSSDSTKSTAPSAVPPSTKVSTASQTPEAIVQGFLTWYHQNQGRLAEVAVVPASLDGDTLDTYAVDFKAADQYLALFRTSGFVSAKYVAEERSNMQQADSVMRLNPQTDGPPPGFDFDHIVCSQDPQADLEKLRRTKPVVTINSDTARVFFAQLPKPEDLREGGNLEFRLVRQQGKWLVEKIRPVSAP